MKIKIYTTGSMFAGKGKWWQSIIKIYGKNDYMLWFKTSWPFFILTKEIY